MNTLTATDTEEVTALKERIKKTSGHHKVTLLKDGGSRPRVTVTPCALTAMEEVTQIMRDRHIHQVVAWDGSREKYTARFTQRLGNGKEINYSVIVEPTTEPVKNYGGGVPAL